MPRHRKRTIAPKPTKRVVLLTQRGRMANMHQILGLQDEPIPPPFVDDVDFVDHKGTASLVTEKPRFYLYRENMPPGGGRVEFHPSQT